LLLCSKGQRLFLLPAESEKESKKNRAILLIEGLAVGVRGLNDRLAPGAYSKPLREQ
jgi:hypothetical protein